MAPSASTVPTEIDSTTSDDIASARGVTEPASTTTTTAVPDTAQFDYRPVAGRIPIFDLSPQLADDLWPAKAFSGEVVPFSATAFREGHDLIGVDLLMVDPKGAQSERRLHTLAPGTDRWGTEVLLDVTGTWRFRFQAYADDYATWLHNAEVKIPAGLDVELMFAIGTELFERGAADSRRAPAERDELARVATRLADTALGAEERLASASDPAVHTLLERRPIYSLPTLSSVRSITVERTKAGSASWYEFFPRSEGAIRSDDGTWTSGTFRTAADRLPGVAAMGFDVLYLPPIHPIGRAFRKGPNNTLDAGEHDPGSPWAIGSADGGHDTIHPDLGTVDDFTDFVAAAAGHGLEVAIDFALQASPDHPWVTEHPEWFTTLPDGSIAYAENPPKKYQDIYPINFDNDPAGIRAESVRLLRHWIGLGVKIFRVDNPHTKPLDFWEWLIHEINAEFPDVVFLAEAFTRPAIMQSLAKAGFQQSYSYFTWRNTKEELTEFFTSISSGGPEGGTADFMRPNLFVNTPDILTAYLQFGGPAAFRIRAALAATAAPLWGVYSGFELYENVARAGAEENIDNEKYEYKRRDFEAAEAAGRSLAPYIRRLNEIRRTSPALGQLRNLTVHSSDDESILVYSKYLAGEFTASGEDDAIIVVANVDPHSVRETTVHLDVTRFGIPAGSEFEVVDLITDARWIWGADNYVRLDAFTEPVHILKVKALTA